MGNVLLATPSQQHVMLLAHAGLYAEHRLHSTARIFCRPHLIPKYGHTSRTRGAGLNDGHTAVGTETPARSLSREESYPNAVADRTVQPASSADNRRLRKL